MDLRKLVFNVEFKGNTSAVTQMNSAADNLTRSMNTSAGAASGLASSAEGATGNVNDLSNSLDNVGNSSGATQAATNINNAGNAVENTTKKLEGMSKKMGDVGKSMSTKITAPIVAMGTAAVMTVAKFDDKMSEVKALTEATGGEFDKLRAQAKQMGADTRFSASEAAEAQSNLASAGFTVNEILSATPGLLSLAAAGGVELGAASEIAAGTLKAFGMEATQTGHVADVLAKTAADTATDIAGLGESMKYVAPVSKAMGVSIEETSAALGIMGDANIKGSQAGTTLRGALTNLAKPAKSAATLMKQLGFNAFDAAGNMKPMHQWVGELQESMKGMTKEQKSAAITTLFGKEAMSGMLAVIEAGPNKVKELTESFENSDGAAKQMADTMEDNIAGAFRSLSSKMESFMIDLGDVIKDDVRKITDFIGKLTGAFGKLPEPAKKAIVVLGLVAAAIGPILVVAAKLINSFLMVKKAFGVLKGLSFVTSLFGGTTAAATATTAATTAASGGFMAMAGSLLATLGPILLIVGALVGLFFAVKKLWKENEAFRENMLGAWEKIKSAVGTAVDFLKGLWEKYGESIINFIGSIVENVVRILQGIVEFVAGVLTGDWEMAWQGICNIFGGLWNGLVTIITGVLSAICEVIVGIFSWIGSFLSAIWEPICSVVSWAWEGIKTVIVTVLEAIKIAIEWYINAVITFWSTVWDGLCTVVSFVWEGIKSIITTVLEAIKVAIEWYINALVTFWTTVWNTIVTIVSTVWETIKSVVTTAVNALWSGITSFISMLVNGWTNAWNNVKTVVTNTVNGFFNLIGRILEFGRQVITSIVNGITSMWASLTSKAKAIGTAIIDAIKALPGQMLQFGKNIVQGLINGVGSMFGALKKKMSSLASSAMSAFKSVLGIHSPSRVFGEFGAWTVEGFTNGIDDNANSAIKTTEGLATGISDGFNNNLNLAEPQVAKVIDINDYLDKTYDTTVNVNFAYDDLPNFNKESTVSYASNYKDNVIPVDFTRGQAPTTNTSNTNVDNTYVTNESTNDFPVVGSSPNQQIHFNPEINIKIQGNVDDESIDKLKQEMRKEIQAEMEEFFKQLNMKIS